MASCFVEYETKIREMSSVFLLWFFLIGSIFHVKIPTSVRPVSVTAAWTGPLAECSKSLALARMSFNSTHRNQHRESSKMADPKADGEHEQHEHKEVGLCFTKDRCRV